MSTIFKKPDKGDPSDIQQVFPMVDIQLLCSRYWWLKNWEFNELSFPYWRIYYNENPGAKVLFNGNTYGLESNKIALIMPNTPFSTKLHNHTIPENGYVLEGRRIQEKDLNRIVKNQNIVSHLYIHFNLGSIYDSVKSGVFLFDNDPFIENKISTIKEYLIKNYTVFSYEITLIIKSLVTYILTKVPANTWKLPSNDSRILDTLNHIENNALEDLSNPALAHRIGLATNSFTRLFTNELNISPQHYVKKSRVNKASVMLHHSHASIDEIAAECGFADRYHFSRVFKLVNNIAPAKYRRDFMMR